MGAHYISGEDFLYSRRKKLISQFEFFLFLIAFYFSGFLFIQSFPLNNSLTPIFATLLGVVFALIGIRFFEKLRRGI